MRNSMFVTGLLVVILLIGIGLRGLAIAHTDPTRIGNVIVGMPLIDDSYYYLSLGKHLAAGDGARVDPDYITTGFQPLWGFLVALPYVLTPQDLIAPLHGVQIMGALIGVLTYFALIRLGRRWLNQPLWAVVIAGIWFLSPQAVRHNVSAMETSLAFLTLILFITALHTLYTQPSPRQAFWVGLLGGLGVLVRIDSALLTGLVGLALLVYPPSAVRWRTALGYGIGLPILLLPWVVFTLTNGKSPFPESGAAVHAMSYISAGIPLDVPFIQLLRDGAFLQFALLNGVLFINWFINQIDLVVATALLWTNPLLVTGVKLLALLLVSFWVHRFVWRDAEQRVRVIIRVWILWFGLMLLAYSLWITANWFYARYTLPLAELATLGILLLLALARSHRWTRYLLVTLCSGIFVMHGIYYAYTENYHWIVNSAQPIPDDGFYRAVQWLEANLQEGERVGAFQSGLTGYFADFPVTNLDGKVNVDAYEALITGTTWEYMCARGIDYWVDWETLMSYFSLGIPEGMTLAEWQAEHLTLVIEFVGDDEAHYVQIYRVNQALCSP